jgi:hypothetical protein
MPNHTHKASNKKTPNRSQSVEKGEVWSLYDDDSGDHVDEVDGLGDEGGDGEEIVAKPLRETFTNWFKSSRQKIQVAVSTVTNWGVVVAVGKLRDSHVQLKALGNVGLLMGGWSSSDFIAKALANAAIYIQDGKPIHTSDTEFAKTDMSNVIPLLPIVKLGVFVFYFMQPVFYRSFKPIPNIMKLMSLAFAVVALKDTPMNSRILTSATVTLAKATDGGTLKVDAVLLASDQDPCMKLLSVVQGWKFLPGLAKRTLASIARSSLTVFGHNITAGEPHDMNNHLPSDVTPSLISYISLDGLDVSQFACTPWWSTQPHIFVVSDPNTTALSQTWRGREGVEIGHPLDRSMYTDLEFGDEFSTESVQELFASKGLKLAPRHVALPSEITSEDVSVLWGLAEAIQEKIHKAIVDETTANANAAGLSVEFVMKTILPLHVGLTKETIKRGWLDSSEKIDTLLEWGDRVFDPIEKALLANPTLAKLNTMLDTMKQVSGESLTISGDREVQTMAVRIIIKDILPYFAGYFENLIVAATNLEEGRDVEKEKNFANAGDQGDLGGRSEVTWPREITAFDLQTSAAIVQRAQERIISRGMAHPLMKIFRHRNAFENLNTQLTPHPLHDPKSLGDRNMLGTRITELRDFIKKYFPHHKFSGSMFGAYGLPFVYGVSLLFAIVAEVATLGRDQTKTNTEELAKQKKTHEAERKATENIIQESERKHQVLSKKLDKLQQVVHESAKGDEKVTGLNSSSKRDAGTISRTLEFEGVQDSPEKKTTPPRLRSRSDRLNKETKQK